MYISYATVANNQLHFTLHRLIAGVVTFTIPAITVKL